MVVVALCFLTAFFVTYFALPSVIHIARDKQLYDVPVARSSHKERTPSLGGIGIFAGTVFAMLYWMPFSSQLMWQYLLGAALILFLLGIKDDLSDTLPAMKIVAQVMAAAIVVLKCDVQLHSFYGVLGFHAPLPLWATVPLSIFTVLVITNAFNLIDGINGLAGSLAALSAGTFAAWFYVTGAMPFAIVAFATLGAVLGFLKYNYSPAQLFMGDSGSLFLGFIMAVLAIAFIDINHALPDFAPTRVDAGPAVAIGILIVPLFDTVRVFITRLIRGYSPFMADRRHIHHLLIDGGCSHAMATTSLVGLNMCMIAGVFYAQSRINMHIILLLTLFTVGMFTFYWHEQVKAFRAATPKSV